MKNIDTNINQKEGPPEKGPDAVAFLRALPKTITGAASIDTLIKPEDAKFCMVHIRQIHGLGAVGAKPLTEQEIENARSEPVDASGLFAKGDWNELIRVQTDIHNILTHLSANMGLRALCVEGLAKKDTVRDAFQELKLWERRQRHFAKAIEMLEPLADMEIAKSNFDFVEKVRTKKIDAEGLYKDENEIHETYVYLKKKYEEARHSLPMQIVKSKESARAELDAANKRADANPKDQYELNNEIKSLRKILDILEKNDGKSAVIHAEINTHFRNRCKERIKNQRAMLDSGLMGSREVLRSGRMTDLPTEDPALNKKAVDAVQRADMRELERIQKLREKFVLESIVRQGHPVVPVVYGGGHDFQNVVNEWNKEPKNAGRKFSLVVVTPKSYKESK